MLKEKKIILASSSPRRKELLEAAGVDFVIRTNRVEEHFPNDMPPENVPAYLAEKKARAAQLICSPDELILAADTIVLLHNKVIGKPRDEKQAREILNLLSGNEHRVISGVCLLKGERVKIFTEMTKVFFRKLTGAQIDFYIENYQPFDKAGAYAIQEWIGLVGVERIEGDYFNVVGLPVGRLLEEIERF